MQLQLQRLHPLGAPAPRRRQRRRRAARDRAGHADAGRDRPLAPRLPALLGRASCSRSTAPGACSTPRAFEAGVASAAETSGSRPGAGQRLPAGRHRLDVGALSGRRPALHAVPHRRSALAAGAGPAFTEDPRLFWHPLAAPLAQLHGEGKVSVMPTVGYTDPNQSHFTSRHFWEVGATQADLHDRLDGPLPRPRRHRRQPAAGALPRRLAEPRAGDRQAAGRHDRPALGLLGLDAGRVGAAADDDVRRLRRARAASACARATSAWSSQVRRR